VHLPSNVVIQETPGGAVVAALDPADDVDVSDASGEVIELAREALGRVLTIVRNG
jgi:hypothetical protein